ncbi:MAG: lactonase family protein [Anaerovoracaceae bacterium]
MSKRTAYIGTYSKGPDGGIFRAEVDAESGSVQILDALDVENPSHLSISPDGRFLYAVSETWEYQGKNGGAAAACRMEEDGHLQLLNMEGTGGKDPCYVSVSPDGRFVYTANYTEGTLSVFDTDRETGRLKDNPLVIAHPGHGVNPHRQEKAHIHITQITPDRKYLAVCDLGIDAVVFYPLDPEQGINPNAGSFIRTLNGEGPRHIAFSSDGRFAYVVTELGNTVCSYGYHDGRLTFLQKESTLPADFAGENTAAAIHFFPDGKTLAVSNRGHDSLAVFHADGGSLQLKQRISTGGRTPREFTCSPDGRFVYVCHQDSSDITVLSVDGDTGLLSETGMRYVLPKPVCMIWK